MATTVASAVSSVLVKKMLAPVAGKIVDGVIGYTKEKWLKYTHSFEKYLSDMEERHKYFSSQVFANEGQLLVNNYIPLTLQKFSSKPAAAKVLISDYPSDLLSAYKDILIIDTAGMGKSTLLKFIFLRALKHGGQIPIFIELRKLSKERPILNYILNELKIGPEATSLAMLQYCLSEGIFIFFLDGFDEIHDDEKEQVSFQLKNLKDNSPRNNFVLSSREEQSLESLNEFHKFGIKPLDIQEAFSLIRKISPNLSVADSLIEKVKAQPEESLKEFLTNPLLVSLLVKSFLHSPVLPVRLSEFYRQVFDSLFQNHDAKKELGGFSRKKRSGLNLDRFHKSMRALGVLTYMNNRLEFSTDELLIQIEKTKTLTTEQSYASSDFMHDLLHAVPIFVQEGATSRWAHRSLQEYFAAAYICIDAKEMQAQYLNQLYDSGVQKNANLLRLCADIDGKTFKQVIVTRYLKDRIDFVKNGYSVKNFPTVDPKDLAERRSLIYDTPPVLFVFPRPMLLADAREFYKKKVPDGPIVGLQIGFSSRGTVASGNEKIKYFVKFVSNRFRAIDQIIKNFYGEDISVRVSVRVFKKGFKGLQTGQILLIDKLPSNPLNAPANFKIATTLLLNLSSYLYGAYDFEKIKSLHGQIIDLEKNSSGVEINFN